MITLGGSAAALLISGQPLLRPWLPLAALLPAFSVCVCVSVRVHLFCGWTSVYTFDLCPLCVCERSVSCSCCAIDTTGLALLCMSTCCMRGAGSPPVLLTSPLSAPLTSSLCPWTKNKQKQFNVRLTFRRAFHRSPLPLARFHPGFFFFVSQFETEVLRPIAIDCLACKTAQLIEKAVSLL